MGPKRKAAEAGSSGDDLAAAKQDALSTAVVEKGRARDRWRQLLAPTGSCAGAWSFCVHHVVDFSAA